MVNVNFTVVADPDRRLITISFKPSFWDESLVRDFVHECQGAVANFEAISKRHLVIVDLREAIIQSQETIMKMQRLLASAPATKIALVAETPLSRMQTKRLQVRDNIVMFRHMYEAEAWLFGADELRNVG